MSDFDPGLSPSTRALLDAARPELGPDPAAIHRMRAGVAAKVGGGLIASSLAAKLGLAAVIATASVAAVLYTTPDASLEDAPHASERDASTAAPSKKPPRVPMHVPGNVIAEPARRAGAIDLAREVALVDEAMAALAVHDAARALAVVAIYTHETRGTGQLAEDAAAIEAEATCTLDVAAAERSLAGFDAKYPQSAQRARVAAACAR